MPDDRPREQAPPSTPPRHDASMAGEAPGATASPAVAAEQSTRVVTEGDRPLESLLARGVSQGIISTQQRERLLDLASSSGDPSADTGAATSTARRDDRSPTEPPRGFNVVSVAYSMGALLVLFAAGWFLIDRWARLGPLGVLGIAAGYATVLAVAAHWLGAHRFRLAAGVCTVLAIAMTPLATWSLLAWAGRWPDPATRDPLLHDAAWMAWQWLVLDLATLLAALVVLWRRPTPAPTWAVAVALWGCWLHLGQLVRGADGPIAFERWLMLASGLALLFVAERVERWQRSRRAPVRGAAGGGARDDEAHGDFANGFWVTGAVATAVAYLAIWGRAEPAWRHLLPLLSLGFLALSLYLRRRSLLLTGVIGVLGYLAYLAGEVFRDYVSFPILLAGFGILLIFVTVWTQLRFPALLQRLDAGRSGGERRLPWSPAMAALPALVALAMAAVSLADAEQERLDAAFRARLSILRLHSGSVPSAPQRRGATAKPLR
jgi:hypothetical protein